MNNHTPFESKQSTLLVNLLWLAPLLIMALLAAACSQISDRVLDQRISSGIIEYQITFPEVSSESITASLLPDRMTYAFSENAFASCFETAGGVFKNRIIANKSTKSLEHEIKVFRKKIKVKMNETDINKMLSQYPNMTVIRTGDKDTIAGYACDKALIVFEEMGIPEIEVYYTKEIKVSTPNWCTQYHEIEGVLMAYEIREFGIRMRLEALSVKPQPENSDFLATDSDYTSITREMMDVELEQLVETFEF